MNLKLRDSDIEATWRTLRLQEGEVSGRRLRAALRQRFGTAGSTTRVFAVWRRLNGERLAEESSEGTLLKRIGELERQLAEALQLQEAALKRAELAEAREIAHQDRWANEIHALRQTVERLQSRRLVV